MNAEIDKPATEVAGNLGNSHRDSNNAPRRTADLRFYLGFRDSETETTSRSGRCGAMRGNPSVEVGRGIRGLGRQPSVSSAALRSNAIESRFNAAELVANSLYVRRDGIRFHRNSSRLHQFGVRARPSGIQIQISKNPILR